MRLKRKVMTHAAAAALPPSSLAPGGTSSFGPSMFKAESVGLRSCVFDSIAVVSDKFLMSLLFLGRLVLCLRRPWRFQVRDSRAGTKDKVASSGGFPA
jgi:hypothetical protein